MHIRGKFLFKCMATITAFGAANAVAVELGNFGGTDVTFKGYLKLDAMISDFDSGELSGSSIGRDFYVPSLTPVGEDWGSTVYDMHARQSRFAFATKSVVDGSELKSYLEMDFMATAGGDERVSNSYVPRMRHAFITYNNWLFGQTWSTFMDVNALPETLDFIGNTDATVFIRQPQIRYTAGSFQFAIENPETTITPYQGGARITPDDNELPDLVARYNLNAGNLSMSFAALARQLQYTVADTIDEKEMSYGLAVSGVVKLGRNDLKFLVNTGSGLGRYVGLNITNAAVLDANDELNAIDTIAYYASFRWFWTDRLRSTISYSQIDIDNDTDLTGLAVNSGSYSTRLNLIYSPAANLTVGGEVALAERDLESNQSGKMTRLQFSAKLAF